MCIISKPLNKNNMNTQNQTSGVVKIDGYSDRSIAHYIAKDKIFFTSDT